VFVIGHDLKELVPFSSAFMGTEYDVTLVEAQDVVRRATTLAKQHEAWFLLILSGDEDPGALDRLEQLAPTMSLVIEDGEDPMIALAHLIAAEAWEAATALDAAVQSAIEAKQQNG